MKKLPFLLLVAVFIVALSSCLKNNSLTATEKWREHNEYWIDSLAALRNPDGTSYYTKTYGIDDKAAYVLMHFFNDRKLTEGNLSPYPSSTVDVKYIGKNCYGEAFDSSFTSTTPADSLARFRPSNLITGFNIALQHMRVGDSCRIAIPWNYAYGSNGSTTISPYSALMFDIKLVDIPFYFLGE